MNLTKLISAILLIGALTGCDKEKLNPEVDKQEAPELTQRVNSFIKNAMDDAYLWYNEIPDIDLRYESDSKDYFDKLLYTEDKWSFITDDLVSLQNSFEGIEKSYGWSLSFGRFSNTGNIFAVVEFVYPNTPASEAGMKRGDVIVAVFGNEITEENYMDLLNSENITIAKGIMGDGFISAGTSVSLSARVLNLDPVLFTNIIEHNGHKIGYLFYAQYIQNYSSSLNCVFQYFMDNSVTDIVLDLRYNHGGGTDAAVHLCSLLAPAGAVNSSDVLVTFKWNDKYQSYWQNNDAQEQLQLQFDKDVPVKMDLNKLYILTGHGTASASELSITGLRPYMNITTVGEATYGKYTASITLKPEYYFEKSSYYENFKTWGIQPVVLRYANSQGVTDFKDGFSPDIYVEDNIMEAVPLGMKEEALLKAAIEDIAGAPVIAMKKATKKVGYSLFDRGFSKYDANKREVLINSFDYNMLINK